MAHDRGDEPPSTWELVGDFLRGFLVAGLALLALFLVPYAVIAVRPRDVDVQIVYGLAGVVSATGLVLGVRLWLQGSWLLIILLPATALLTLPPIVWVELRHWGI